MSDVEKDLLAGLWVPSYYGIRRFRVARQSGRWRDEETSMECYDTLDEARAECNRRNSRLRTAS